MPRQIPLIADRYRYDQRVPDLDGVAVVLRLQWLPRLRGWYVDVETTAGDVLARGRRIEPGALSLLPDRTLNGVPPGLLIAAGTQTYLRDQLTGPVRVEYILRAEL